jgi:hypothetical protein
MARGNSFRALVHELKLCGRYVAIIELIGELT